MSIIVNGNELTEIIYAGVNLDIVKVKKGAAEAVTVFEKMTQLSTPQNVTADGTVVSWDEVENATSYEVLADGASIGTVEATPTPTLISFTIAGTSYQAEEGMTWAEWCDSKYNTDGYFVIGTDISGSHGGRLYTNHSLTTPVLSTDAIISGWNYSSSGSGGVGN